MESKPCWSCGLGTALAAMTLCVCLMPLMFYRPVQTDAYCTQDCLVYNIVLVGLLYSAISHTWNCTVLQEKVNPLK